MTTNEPAAPIFSLDDVASIIANALADDPYDMDEDQVASYLVEAFVSDAPVDGWLSSMVWVISHHPSYSDGLRNDLIVKVQAIVEQLFEDHDWEG